MRSRLTFTRSRLARFESLTGGSAWTSWRLWCRIVRKLNRLVWRLQNGLWTALPYLTAWISSFPISYVSDLCIKRNIVTTEASRKICNTFSQVVPALALIGLGYVNNDQPALAEAILVIAVTTNIASYCGYNVNHMDLSPNFAGTLMGFTNAAANICSLLAPIVAGWIAPDTVRAISVAIFARDTRVTSFSTSKYHLKSKNISNSV